MSTHYLAVGDGSTRRYQLPYTVPRYSTVDVRLNGTLQTEGYTFDRISSYIEFSTAPPEGTTVSLRRRTPNVVTHSFGQGASFNPFALDENFNQVLTRNEEVEDGALLVEVGLQGNLDANGYRIENLAPAEAPGQALTWEQFRPFEIEFDNAQSDRESQFDAAQDAREAQFEASQQARSLEWEAYLSNLGYRDVGVYREGLTIHTYNAIFSYGETGYRVSTLVPLPYTLTGDWGTDAPNLVQIQFVSARALEEERLARVAGDANLQSQISGGAPLEASAFSPVSWHSQTVQNSLTIPDNVNAWSFGPTMSIAAGQTVTIGENSHWTIANGEIQQ